MENYSIYLKKLKVAVGILAIALVILILLITKIVPIVQNISSIQNEYKTQSATLADTERKLSDLKSAAERKKKEDANAMKAFFKPIEMSMDTEAVMSDEFGEILQLIRENKIKARSVKYDYDPQDDNFVKNAGDRYSACRVNIEMVAKYSELENFLRDLYKHEHFLEISKIEIAPYEKNKRILLVTLQVKLYAQKDPSLAPPKPAATEAPAAQGATGGPDTGIINPGGPQTPEAPMQPGPVSPELES